MAYPTLAQLNFKAVDGDLIGSQPIMETSTSQKHPLGTLVKGNDFGSCGLGQATFVYLKGIASTAAGDIVAYDSALGVTARSATTSRGPLAIAMSANVANQFGWYAVAGNVPVNTTAAGTGAALATLALTGTAQATVATGGAAAYVLEAVCKTAQDTVGAVSGLTGFTSVQLSYPTAIGGTGVTPT